LNRLRDAPTLLRDMTAPGRLPCAPQRIAIPFGGGLLVALFVGAALLLGGSGSAAEAQSRFGTLAQSSSSGTLMCREGWTMVGARCRLYRFGSGILWRDAIRCAAGHQPNFQHTGCELIPVSLPSIPNFRLASGRSVNTTFPAATGGRPPYTYSVSGLPPGITFYPSTRGASGTLPTVTADTTYRITYTVRDSTSGLGTGTASVSFTAVVLAPPAPTPTPTPTPTPAPTPTPVQPSDPPTVPVDAVRLYSLPFSVSETGEGEKEYRFRLESRTEVSVSLTGMNRDIDCRVNSSTCTNRGGTRDDSWNGTLAAGTHTVTVYPYNADFGNWTLSVSGTATSPTPSPPTPSPSPTEAGPIVKTGVNVSSSRTFPFTLSHRADVSVELTGMTTDFDCTVSGNRCTNRGGTSDDSWTGTLGAGEHKIVVYPYGGGSGNYTLTISAGAPSTGGSTGTRTQVTTLVDVSRMGVSTSQTHSFTLSGPADVDVALTGLTIDFDCRVGSSRCTNRWGSQDDSWSGDLDQGNHSVVVYPYDPGPGDYSLTVTATETLGFGSAPLAGGPITLRFCEEEDGVILEDTCVEIVIHREGNPDDGGDGDGPDGPGGPGGPGGPTTPQEPTPGQKEGTARADAAARARNPVCRQFFRRHGERDIVGALSGVSFDSSDRYNQCSAPDDAAYIVRGVAGTIFTCPHFYSGSRTLRADTVLHEMLHLAGKSHQDLGGEGAFHQAVMNACP